MSWRDNRLFFAHYESYTFDIFFITIGYKIHNLSKYNPNKSFILLIMKIDKKIYISFYMYKNYIIGLFHHKAPQTLVYTYTLPHILPL